ncbi:hypothetical protein ACFFRR_007838 [Megaselia abdita]
MYNGSEDLLPRSAPVPSVTSAPVTIAKPTVPEVSIIFGEKKTSNGTNSNAIPKPIQSYSDWKKQCLPHVMYHDEGVQAGSSSEISPRNNIYPMKAPVISQSRLSMSPQAPVYTSPSQQARVATPPMIQPQQQVHLGSINNFPMQPARITTPPVHQNEPFSIDNNLISSLKQALGLRDPFPVNQTREQLIQSMQPPTALTICAGTQTDPEPKAPVVSNTADFATKEDVREIMNVLHEMRTEQIQLMQLLQITLENRSVTREVGIQCEINVSANQHHLALEDYRATPKANGHFQKSRTPQQNFRTPYKNQVLSKPTTEQSLVMNELAMKYLPSHKLSDLLQEIHTHENHSPLRVIDNVLRTPISESPNDISNASYKYLKKYRLLPEEEENQDLDLDAIRNQPKFL